ncbi:hypothetical protein HaLaN_18797 [Haematococcus lacustris]|uniref:Uncharacterized protein n=1 Tax=Haematococcus lacustris TaxID=44745 RepID=A0A699ZFZ0_HAELA|nr:hypothetical protein HaLaN_18797 [Haematococcus lacustris]
MAEDHGQAMWCVGQLPMPPCQNLWRRRQPWRLSSRAGDRQAASSASNALVTWGAWRCNGEAAQERQANS